MKKLLILFSLIALLSVSVLAEDTADKKEETKKEEIKKVETKKGEKTEKAMEAKVIETESGLKYIEVELGEGSEAKAGMTVEVHYTGWLDEKGEKGKKFDSSVDRGTPFSFPLGAGRVIKGWDEGVAGMKIGGKRTLIIPADLGYGSRGAGGVIPPNATLIFDVELLGVK